MASTYNAPDYNEKKYRQGVDTSYYDKAIKEYTNQANKERKTQIADAQKTQQANLRQAYANRLQNEQKMNKNLALSGIRGGATETANLNLMNQYGQARASANSDYANSVNQINQNISKNIMDYTNDMKSRAEEYRQNMAQSRWQSARENYANQWNAQREDANMAYERNQAEINRQTEYWSNFYTNYYSGYSKKNAQKAVKNLRTTLAKTTDPLLRIRYEQAIAGANARLGVIATSK